MNDIAPVATDLNISDIPVAFTPVDMSDYIRREVTVPMRDGAKLFTVILIPKGVDKAPIVIDRTPYSAAKNTRMSTSPLAAMVTWPFHGDMLAAGYIVVVQDVRGKHKSEGVYVMNRPLRGPLNPSETDHATDAYDTIEWLVNTMPESNGRVGTFGISYDGFTTLMSLIDPHPALKAAMPVNPMVDGWIGDDWFQFGAFRQTVTLQYIYAQTASKGSEIPWPLTAHDLYETWLEAGSAGAMAAKVGMAELPFWQRVAENPAYTEFWSQQAADRILADRPPTVPTLMVHSQWDAEDIHGIMDVHKAIMARGGAGENTFLVIGPWSHTSCCAEAGASLGAIKFGSDTARHFRQQFMIPFFDAYLKDDGRAHGLPPVSAFETGSNVWKSHQSWPQAAAAGAPHGAKPLYLAAGAGLSFDPPTEADGADSYVSDPAKPVTDRARPIRGKGPGTNYDASLVDDQRFADGRPDVLTYASQRLTAPLRLAGQPVAHLYAATTGTDCDWVVKLIDVYPDEVQGDPALGGFQMPIAMGILRGRYRNSFAAPSPIEPGKVEEYVLRLPHIAHALLPGHRLMVQIQSSWFPLYDRNPQTYVPNIMFAEPEDYVAATQRVFRSADAASHIELPIIS
jgi:putative CocE/NonD family hydrolase